MDGLERWVNRIGYGKYTSKISVVTGELSSMALISNLQSHNLPLVLIQRKKEVKEHQKVIIKRKEKEEAVEMAKKEDVRSS